jgi:hypothetical protein
MPEILLFSKWASNCFVCCVNAVAARSSFDSGIPAASPPPVSHAHAPTGFISLINALLGSQEPPQDTASVAPGDSPDSTSGPPVQVRSAAEIADAMIRSMLGSPIMTSNLSTDQTSTLVPVGTSKGRQPKEDSQPATGQAQLPVNQTASFPVPTVPLPLLPAVPVGMAAVGETPVPAGQNNTPGGTSRFRTGSAVASSELKPTVAKADLAFALRLTPLELPERSAAAAATQAPLAGAPAVPLQETQPVPQETTQIARVMENAQEPVQADSQSKDNPPSNASHPALTETKPKQGSDQNAEAPVMATAASGDHSGDSARPLPNPLPTFAAPRPVEQGQTEPIRTAEQALRTSEGAPTSDSAPKTATAQQISVRVTGPDSPAVDLHVTERAGQVLVSVRTPDTGLQASLRQDLGTLVNSLERSGYRAEALTGRDSATLTGTGMIGVASQTAGASFMDARNHSQNSGQNGEENAGQNSRGGSQQRNSSQDQPNHSGDQQQRRGRPQPNWIDTLEKTQ